MTVWLTNGSSTFQVMAGTDQHRQMLADGWQESTDPKTDSEPESVEQETDSESEPEIAKLLQLSVEELRKMANELLLPEAQNARIKKAELIAAILAKQAPTGNTEDKTEQ
jgi:FtsZ-binding cell division protein ZapB